MKYTGLPNKRRETFIKKSDAYSL